MGKQKRVKKHQKKRKRAKRLKQQAMETNNKTRSFSELLFGIKKHLNIEYPEFVMDIKIMDTSEYLELTSVPAKKLHSS